MFILEEKYLLTCKPIYVNLSFLRRRLGVSGICPIDLGLVGYVYLSFSINTITAGIRDKSGFLSTDDGLAGHGWSELDVRIRQSDC